MAALEPSRTQSHTHTLVRESDSDPTPLVILRVQVISCDNLVARDRNGFSDPFVVVSMLGKEFKTPVCKRNLNPIYPPEYATFEFPIYMSLVHKLGTLNLKFVVWNKDMLGNDFLGKNALPVNEWFKDTAFAFDDPHNQPIHFGLLSSRTNTIPHGSICVKVGFVQPPNSTSHPDLRNTYDVLAIPGLTNPVTPMLGIGSSKNPSFPDEAPVVILRVQILSCHNLEAKNRSGYSDPFVIVSIWEKEFKTPVCKRNLNPIFKPKDATFDFPIYMSHLHKLGVDTLKFVVCQWDKDITVNGILGEYELPVKHWFKGTAFAFDDPNDQPFFFGLLSSRSTTAVRGTVRTKVGFVHPPNSTVLPDFEKTYNILTNFIFPVPLDFGNTYSSLANSVYPVGPQADHVGVVTLLIWGARGLPDWPTVTRIGWDMDPFLKVTIGDEVQRTQVIRHDLNPVWNKQLDFHVRERDLLLPITLSVYDWDIFSFHNHVGDVKIHISQLVWSTSKKDRAARFYDGLPTMSEFNDVPLTPNPARPYKSIPTLTFRAGYQSYDELRQQVGH